MCGRFTLRATLADVADYFRIDHLPDWDWPARFNLAPTQAVLAVRLTGDGRREMVRLRWGLIPSWAKDLNIGSRLINARAETAHEKPSFRAAFARRRCLVAADGYYEWEKAEAGKQPYLFEMRDGSVFAIAGLWERWHGDEGDAIESVTLLTVPASPDTEAVHHRMPAILPREHFEMWLGESPTADSRCRALLRPLEEGTLRMRPVSSFVNRPIHEGPQCVAPPG